MLKFKPGILIFSLVLLIAVTVSYSGIGYDETDLFSLSSILEDAGNQVSDFKIISTVNDPENRTVTVSFTLSAPQSGCSAALYSIDGKLLRELRAATGKDGQFKVVWNGADSQGTEAAMGIYLLKIRSGQSAYSLKIIKNR